MKYPKNFFIVFYLGHYITNRVSSTNHSLEFLRRFFNTTEETSSNIIRNQILQQLPYRLPMTSYHDHPRLRLTVTTLRLFTVRNRIRDLYFATHSVSEWRKFFERQLNRYISLSMYVSMKKTIYDPVYPPNESVW